MAVHSLLTLFLFILFFTSPPLSSVFNASLHHYTITPMLCHPAVLLCAALLPAALACDSLGVLPSATADGIGGFYGKNADRNRPVGAPRGPLHGGVADLFYTDVRSILMVL